LLFLAFIPALLLPLRAPAAWRHAIAAIRRVRFSAVAVYGVAGGIGVLALMLRTWLYTGQFSLLYGTSMKYNDTGLRSLDVFNPQVWAKVAHSLANFVFMNEPPRPELRAVFVMGGVAVALAALAQIRWLRRVSASVVLVTLGAGAGSFVAHGHSYPGRFSIHLVPLAVALATMALAMAVPVGAFDARSARARRATAG